MGAKDISAAEAVKLFKSQGIKVQEARPAKAKGEDGKVREGFETKMADLAAAHVLAARQYGDGRVAMTTIDGRRYETQARGE